MTIRFNDVHAIKLIMEASHVQFVPRMHFCIADYDKKDCLTGGVLYTDYWGGSVMMHVAGFKPHWGGKGLLWLAFDYPFNQIKVKKVFGLVPEYNWRARHFDLHLGFKMEYLINGVFDRVDNINGMYLMSMKREECRWLDMPKPRIDLAPMERTNPIDQPLAALPTIGGMQ